MKLHYGVLIILIAGVLATGIVAAADTPGGSLGAQGSYSISSTPSGATVTFDGRNEGTTPVTVDVSTSGTPGHTIRITLDGFQSWSNYYPDNPGEGETIYVSADLVPIPVTQPTTEITTSPTQIGGGKGYYDISSSPSGASITFDGRNEGTTPVTVDVSTSGSPGHTVGLMLDGYQPWSGYYPGNPADGATVYVSADLVPIPITQPTTSPTIGGGTGYYEITSRPSGAYVTFDGRNQGVTPVTVDVSSTGTPGHTISVTMGGYQPWSQTYQGNPFEGETIHVIASLVPIGQYGSISVGSSPQGAYAVLDNGIDYLTTPGTFTGVASGWHNVRISKAGYQAFSQNVHMTLGGTANVFASLAPNPQTGRISVTSNPSGAGLYIDTIYQGEAPMNAGNLGAGSHTVTLRKAGYQVWSGTYTVNAGQTTYVNAGLVPFNNPATGDLEISSAPSGAAVYVDGDYQGTTEVGTTLDVLSLTAGSHPVLLRKSGYQDYSIAAVIRAGQIAQVYATLVSTGQPSAKASIQVTSDPAGADVTINNAYAGITPLTLQNVAAGISTVSISSAGYQMYTTSIQVSAGQAVQVNAALTPVATPTKTPLEPALIVISIGIAGFVIAGFRRNH